MEVKFTAINKSQQVENMEQCLAWIKTCPFHFSISSMSGGFMHLKIMIPTAEVFELECDNDGTNKS